MCSCSTAVWLVVDKNDISWFYIKKCVFIVPEIEQYESLFIGMIIDHIAIFAGAITPSTTGVWNHGNAQQT
jgi:hypothetical protein